MIKIYTTKHKRNGEKGNCIAASLASVLEMHIESIPQFEELTPLTWRDALIDWCKNSGIYLKFTKERPTGYAIGVGIHSQGGLHAVVVYNGEFFFDVNGSDLFYQEHRYYIIVERISQPSLHNG